MAFLRSVKGYKDLIKKHKKSGFGLFGKKSKRPPAASSSAAPAATPPPQPTAKASLPKAASAPKKAAGKEANSVPPGSGSGAAASDERALAKSAPSTKPPPSAKPPASPPPAAASPPPGGGEAVSPRARPADLPRRNTNNVALAQLGSVLMAARRQVGGVRPARDAYRCSQTPGCEQADREHARQVAAASRCEACSDDFAGQQGR